jgi:hypothetical protein
MVAGDAGGTSYLPLKGSLAHLEMLLQHMHQRTRLDAAPSNLAMQLDFIARNVRRRMMMVIITDDAPMTPQLERLVKRLRVQHEIMWIAIADADPTSAASTQAVREVETGSTLPDFLIGSRAFSAELERAQTERWLHTSQVLQRLGVVSERISSDETLLPSIFSLLKRQRGTHGRAAR